MRDREHDAPRPGATPTAPTGAAPTAAALAAAGRAAAAPTGAAPTGVAPTAAALAAAARVAAAPTAAGAALAPAAPAPLARSGASQRAATLGALQASAGNRAVARALARQAAPPAAPANAQATAEAEAVETVGRLRTAHERMFHHAEVRVRNTAQMFDPPGSPPAGHRMRAEPMTLRSDSAQLVTDRNEDPTTTAYYFRGTHQDNEVRMGPRTLGTINGSTLLVRGRGPDGTWQPQDDLISTFVHETSHVLVADYGEHPGTSTDASSFDRYRDEFRAYYVEPGFAAGTTGDARAAQIRLQLVGTSATSGGYERLRAEYWREPHATNTFRAQVDGHLRPDGFNLDNSPKLDRLVSLLRDLRTGAATVEDAVFQITVLSAAERAEAASASLVTTLLARVPTDAAARIRSALASPAAVGFGRELNPNDSPRVTTLLGAIVTGAEEPIKEAYRALTPADKGSLYLNAHVLAWIRHAMADAQRRACVIVMLNTGSVAQYDAAWALQQACWAAHDATELPAPLRSALRALSFHGKLSFYRFGDEAYTIAVNPLPDAFRREVIQTLRAEREP